MAQVKQVHRDGTEVLVAVNVGDSVGFKSDYEQYGQIIAIDGDRLTLENKAGFGGEYLRYATTTIESARDCWTEDHEPKPTPKPTPKSLDQMRADRVWCVDFDATFPGFGHADCYEDESGYVYEDGSLVITRSDSGPDAFHVELFGGAFVGTLAECEAELYKAASDEGFFK